MRHSRDPFNTYDQWKTAAPPEYEEEFRCDTCGAFIDEYDIVEIYGDILCQDCANEEE